MCVCVCVYVCMHVCVCVCIQKESKEFTCFSSSYSIIMISILIYIYIFFLSLVCESKERKVNISKWIGPQRDLYLFKIYLFTSYICFLNTACFLQRIFNLFSGVVSSLYRSHCFDGLVVSFNFLINSFLGLVLPFTSFSFSFFLSFSFSECVSCSLYWVSFIYLFIYFPNLSLIFDML